MFEWLFGKKAKPRPQQEIAHSSIGASSIRQRKGLARVDIRDEGHNWLSIPATGFYGSYTLSPNGEFRIAWRDSGPDSDDGYYVLIKGEEIICQGRMERPQDGKVADNGIFILNDWRASSDLTGTFRAFRADGSQLLAHDFAANLFNNGLSADGRLAACQTCNSGDEHDSAVLTVFDLTQGKELHRLRPESGRRNPLLDRAHSAGVTGALSSRGSSRPSSRNSDSNRGVVWTLTGGT